MIFMSFPFWMLEITVRISPNQLDGTWQRIKLQAKLLERLAGRARRAFFTYYVPQLSY
ncbi:MAG TPA: hypothetical protein VN784_00805 [Candidatus Limnocylindrales bacterium]|nr:hypothetical protein [Candidatus Limnocylindrales bacterium]